MTAMTNNHGRKVKFDMLCVCDNECPVNESKLLKQFYLLFLTSIC